MAADPIRCFTCGKVLQWEKFSELVSRSSEGSVKQALDQLQYNRICCRRMFVSSARLPEQSNDVNDYFQSSSVEFEVERNKGSVYRCV